MTLPMDKWLGKIRTDDHLVAWNESREWRQSDFRRDVLSLISQLRATQELRWAICVEDNYAFAVALLAVLYSGKTAVLPGHFRQAVLAEQHGEFDALITDLPLQLDCLTLSFPWLSNDPLLTLPEWPEAAALILFTSGSTGKPQKIIKTISSLEQESQWLSALWGEELSESRFAATVAPHHMYGLTFAFMLPLSLGIPFYSKSIEYHEQLSFLAKRHSLVLIGSPAFLQRLDPALESITCRYVFSAGGPLSNDAAQQVTAICGLLPTEIYGTTESGVIAFRQQRQRGAPWTLFDNVRLIPQPDGAVSLISPLIPLAEGISLSDEIKMLSNPRYFHLLGRKDRIVKIAEQRISLNEIEQRLCSIGCVRQARALTIEKQGRIHVAAVIVLSEAGEQQLHAQGKTLFLGELRQALRAWLSPVSLPRFWRIVPVIPLNQQGKCATAELQEMFL